MKAKKIISIVLVLAVMLGAFATIFSFGASAILNEDGTYTPGDGIESYRFYFAMPESWRNQFCKDAGDCAGLYWWSGTDACGAIDGSGGSLPWPGYKVKAESKDQKNLFYIDIPQDVPKIIWNNSVDGGLDENEPVYSAACQTPDLPVGPIEGNVEGDGTMYDDLDGFWDLIRDAWNNDAMDQFGDNASCFEEGWFDDFAMTYNNMIYVIDPSKTSYTIDGKLTYGGDWFFMYDNGYYGSWPTKEMAEEQAANNNGVYKTIASAISSGDDPVDPISDPTTETKVIQPSTNEPTSVEPTSKPSQSSTTPKSSTSSNAVTTNKSAIQTGSVTFALAFLTLLAIAAGVVIFIRKKKFN